MNPLTARSACLLHIFIIVLSNYAVQLPLTIFGLHTTYGTFTYPLIFVATDLTVRIFGARAARRIVYRAMIPALIASYVIGTIFEHGNFCGFGALGEFSTFVFRIAAASLGAYVIGQLSDILVFSRLRRLPAWWPAPATSTVAGNFVDTLAFFAIAFWHTTDPFMAEHWVELAIFDYGVKLVVGLMLFVPVYGVLLSFLSRFVFHRPLNGAEPVV